MSRVNYKKLAREDSFVGQYLAFSENSETPYAYDFWTALWCISVALGRDIAVDRPSAPVYLNLYCVLVAESGVTRKSTAVRRAVSFIRPMCDDRNQLIESKITPEKLEFDLALQSIEFGCARASIAIDEMVKFLGKEKYVETMPTLLTDLYDCPALRVGGGTLLRGSTVLRDVHVNFLSASTPSWLLRAVNPDVIEGGFTSRVVFVVSEKPKRTAPWPTKPDERQRSELLTRLATISEEAKRYPTIALSEGAMAKFKSWYKNRELKRDPYRASFQSREDSHILRVAALLCVSDGTWEIQTVHINTAIKVVIETREDGAAIFEGTGANSKIVLGVDALRDKLLAAGIGGIKHSELSKHCQRFMDAEHTKAALDVMHELGMVQKFEGISLGRGRPTTVWRAKQALVASNALDTILSNLTPAAGA